MTGEQVRQHYLQALGIDSYLPRWQLPGAAPSCLLAEVETEDELEVADQLEQIPQVQPQQAGPQSAPLRPRLDIELDAKQSRPRIPVAEPARDISLSPRFALGIWQISPEILVLDSRQPRSALPVGRLLQNMAVALGLSGGLSAPEVLRWPPADAGNIYGDEAAARAHMQAFLAARAGLQPIHHVLLMGAPAIRFCLHGEQLGSAGDLRALLGKSLPLAIEGHTLTAIALPSLAAMLQRPQLKAEVWKAIKHLRRV